MVSLQYSEDILKEGFESAVIKLPDDYEGAVVATLVRKLAENSKKAVLYIHGFNDYFFQKEFANQVVANGLNFYALDLRKYGRSILPHQKPNNIRKLTEYFAEITIALAQMRKEGAEKILLAGHSNGGLIVTLFALKSNVRIEAVFCNSPFYEMNMSDFFKRKVVPFVSKIGMRFPNFRLPRIFSNLYGRSLHKDANGYWQYNLNWKPHVAFPINVGWVNAVHKAHRTVHKGVKLNIPVLVMHATESLYLKEWDERVYSCDIVLAVKDIKRYAKKIKSPALSVIPIEGAIHDVMLSKPDVRKVAYNEFFGWLKKIEF